MQNDKEVARELLFSLKEDTKKVEKLPTTGLYSTTSEGRESLFANAKFENMGLKQELLDALYSLKFEKPSLIQASSIPHIISGHDCAFQSKSGTGKTIAFTTGALQTCVSGSGVQVVILSPTRELALQIGNVVEKLGSLIGIKVCYALGTFVSKEITEEVVVGCPGKIIGLCNSGALKTDSIKMLVLDEADDLITKQSTSAMIMRLLKIFEKSQKVFFSATYSDISQRALTKMAPNSENFFKENVKADKIELYQIATDRSKKIQALKSILSLLTVAQTIVFVNTKVKADEIKDAMEADGFSVSMIHGNMSYEERDAAFIAFGAAKTKILITTNVFSRGMDIPQVNLIINFDIPNYALDEPEQTYIHRIGRSGRFNRSGFVIDFVSGEEDLNQLTSIHTQVGAISKKFTIEALEEVFAELDAL